MSNANGNDILEQIKAAGRKVLPMHEYLAETDPNMLKALNNFLNFSIYQNNSLDECYKEMILACVCVAAGSSQPVIANHCRKAMAAGLSREAMLQGLEIAAAVMTTRTMASGVLALMEADD